MIALVKAHPLKPHSLNPDSIIMLYTVFLKNSVSSINLPFSYFNLNEAQEVADKINYIYSSRRV